MPPTTSLRILIVEDHDDSRSIIGRVLRDRAHVVHEAGDAATGLAIFAKQELDLVICDIGLPDFDGNELLTRMRRLKQVRSIALTANRSRLDRLTARDSGFSDYITKPADLRDLLAVVEQR